jgi:hypothetical protein
MYHNLVYVHHPKTKEPTNTNKLKKKKIVIMFIQYNIINEGKNNNPNMKDKNKLI